MDTDRIKGAAQDFGGKVQETVGRVAGDQKTQVEGVVRQIVGQGQDLYGQAKDTVRDVTDNFGDYANQAYDNSGDYASRGAQVARQEIGEHPLTSVVLAGAVGYLLAMIIHGRR